MIGSVQLVARSLPHATRGAEREQWRLAMQADAQALQDQKTFADVSKEEVRAVKYSDILPMKLVTGTKRDALAGTECKTARAVVCGNFQKKAPGEDLYTAPADITS